MKANKFYEALEEKEKYKLINGLFIVKYVDEFESIFIGEFLKSGTALNDTQTNLIRVSSNGQRFRKLKDGGMITFNGLAWKNLDISFNEQDIEEIL